MNKKLLTACLVTTALCPIMAVLTSCKEETTQAPAVPPDVQVTELVRQDVSITEEWIASLRGTEDAKIRPRVNGYLLSKEYKDGTYVNKGDILFLIDPRPFQVALDQARGQLAQAQANAEKFSLDVKKYEPLVEKGVVSRKDYDDAVQSLKEAEASIKTYQAAVANAEIDLKFTKIEAPISGLAGLAQPSIGDLLSPSSEALTTISSIDPIRVDFAISESQFLNSFKKKHVSLQEATFDIILANGQLYPEKGKLVAVDSNVDRQTGTIQLVGQVANPKRELRPGMFVRVRAVIQVLEHAALVPARAVLKVQNMNFIVGVGADNIPYVFPVKTGKTIGNMQVVEPVQGEFPEKMTVVVEGIMQAAQRQGKQPVNPTPYIYQQSQPIIDSKALSSDNNQLKPEKGTQAAEKP